MGISLGAPPLTSAAIIAALGYIPTDDNVGIGTTNASARLTIKGTTADSTAYSLSAYDSNDALVYRQDNAGRIDMWKRSTDGAIMVIGILPTVPANGQRAGHYALTALDSNHQQHTIGILESYITDITNTSMGSSIVLRYMDNVNGNPGGVYAYQQPNKSVTFSSAGFNLPDIPVTNTSNVLKVRSAAAMTTSPGEVLRLEAGYDGGAIGSGGMLTFHNPPSLGGTRFGSVQSTVESNGEIGMGFSTYSNTVGFGERLRISAKGNVTITSGYLAGAEQTAPAASAANGYRIFAQDNGAGKTQLMVIFASGSAQQLAIQP